MPARLRAFLRFAVRVWEREDLAELHPVPDAVGIPRKAVTLDFLLARETLPPPGPPRGGTNGDATLRKLFAGETLPPPPAETPARPRSLLKFLLTREKLPSTAETE